jgi:hypothetical protein
MSKKGTDRSVHYSTISGNQHIANRDRVVSPPFSMSNMGLLGKNQARHDIHA